MAIPAIPTGFQVQQGNGIVYLSWNITTGATSYKIQRSINGVSFSDLDTSSVNNYLDSSVSVGTQYYYQIAAVNGSGTSGYVTPLSAIPALAGQLSLGEIRLRAQQAADRENSQFLTLSEWNFNINQSAAEFYDLLITAYEDYFVAPRLTFSTDGSSSQFDLPTGLNYSSAPAFYKLYGVDCGLDASQNAWLTLKKFNFIERNKFVFPQMQSSLLGIFNMQYRVVGGKIMFVPIPSANLSIGLWYFPRITTLLADTDILDGIGGWTEYVIIDSAIKALRKEESDTTLLFEQKMMLKKRIEEAAQHRDAGQPDTISDVRTRSESWGSGDGPIGGW